MGDESIIAEYFDGSIDASRTRKIEAWLKKDEANVQALAIHGAIHWRLSELMKQVDSRGEVNIEMKESPRKKKQSEQV